MNNLLSHPVTRSRLATENGYTRLLLLPVLRRHSLQGQVTVDNSKDVQLLTLILVDSLDLDIKQSGGVDGNVCGVFDMLGKANFVGILNLSPLLLELLVIRELLNLVQGGKVLEESISTSLGSNELTQARVGLVQPSARGNTVGDIGELVGAIDLDEILEDGGLDKIGVKLGHTVHLVRANDSKECHPDHLGLRLLNNGNPREEITVIGELLLYLLQEVEVNIIDDLEMSGKEMLDQAYRPLFKSLRENGMICVTELL